jgi:hypothetical protein
VSSDTGSFIELNGNILYNLELNPILKSNVPPLPIKSFELSECNVNKPDEMSYVINGWLKSNVE